MTGETTLTYGLVLENKRAALRGVALEARFVLAQKSKAAAFERLLDICRRALHGHPHVRIVTISTTDLAFQHRMVMRHLKLCAHFQVTLETGFWRLTGIDDRVRRAAAFDVQTSRPVTRFAAHVLCVLPFGFQAGMGRGSKIARDILVAGLATFRSNELRTRDTWWG